MTSIQSRVAVCFSHVFPSLRPEELPAASVASLALWDSVAHVTLLSSISEEFGVDFEVEDFEQLVSYQQIVDYLEKRPANE